MLENTPFKPAHFQDRDRTAFRGRALRVVGWSDLTARINAARDLRELLKQDLVMGGASFTDAAAGYFVPSSSSERDVNHDALGPCKGLDDNSKLNENAADAIPPEDAPDQGVENNK